MLEQHYARMFRSFIGIDRHSRPHSGVEFAW
jgi:hypothetical protein